MNQEDLIKDVFIKPANMHKLDLSNGAWQMKKKRFRDGSLSDKEQVKILTKLGFKIIKDRQWK
jgi:hypothetical protein